MTHPSNRDKILRPQFVDQDPKITSLFGIPADKAASITSGTALFAALLVIPAVFLASSKDANVKTFGIWIGYLVWAVFVVEILVFIRLEKGWGGSWLKKHWLQLFVVFLASPLTGLVLKHTVMPLATILFGIQNLISAAIVTKMLVVLKLMKLEEARQKLKKGTKQVKFLYRTAIFSIWFCGIGVVGAAASDGAPTPAHGLALWWELAGEMANKAPELFLVSIPIVAVIGGFALLQHRMSPNGRR